MFVKAMLLVYRTYSASHRIVERTNANGPRVCTLVASYVLEASLIAEKIKVSIECIYKRFFVV